MHKKSSSAQLSDCPPRSSSADSRRARSSPRQREGQGQATMSTALSGESTTAVFSPVAVRFTKSVSSPPSRPKSPANPLWRKKSDLR